MINFFSIAALAANKSCAPLTSPLTSPCFKLVNVFLRAAFVCCASADDITVAPIFLALSTTVTGFIDWGTTSNLIIVSTFSLSDFSIIFFNVSIVFWPSNLASLLKLGFFSASSVCWILLLIIPFATSALILATSTTALISWEACAALASSLIALATSFRDSNSFCNSATFARSAGFFDLDAFAMAFFNFFSNLLAATSASFAFPCLTARFAFSRILSNKCLPASVNCKAFLIFNESPIEEVIARPIRIVS